MKTSIFRKFGHGNFHAGFFILPHNNKKLFNRILSNFLVLKGLQIAVIIEGKKVYNFELKIIV